jgi:hypothetical protein
MKIQYNTGDPKETGVYAVRAEDVQAPGSGLLRDYFLMRHNKQWWYLGSDSKFRSDVLGWIGPLARRWPTPDDEDL